MATGTDPQESGTPRSDFNSREHFCYGRASDDSRTDGQTLSIKVNEATWRVSLKDRLIESETGVGLDGYVRGVRWHC
ncbi:hypothetical protein [Streptomyces sp. BH055]|uniref:YxiG-like protein n=1 Tax=unclassified Streptomyces TaxID=2593676 RepID=UPI003BB49F87